MVIPAEGGPCRTDSGVRSAAAHGIAQQEQSAAGIPAAISRRHQGRGPGRSSAVFAGEEGLGTPPAAPFAARRRRSAMTFSAVTSRQAGAHPVGAVV
jgi:hypothetical protein